MMKGILVCFSVLTLLCVAGSTTPCNTVNCFVDPCSVTTCSAYPTATCRSNYCGGCYADFFDAAGTNVTALCNSVAPTTVSPPLSCPPPTGFGLCVEACTADTVCQSGQICCNTGCGHACVDGIAATQSPGCVSSDGRLVPSGSSFPSSDGCNTCSCGDNGLIFCTERACITTATVTPPTTQYPCTLPCPLPLCLEGYTLVTLPGQCCPTCQLVPTTPSPPDCSQIFCDWPICPDGAEPVSLPGECCPSCPLPSTTGTPPVIDCGTVLCALPRCAGGITPVVPPGQCCPQCPEIEGCVTADGRVIARGDSFPAPDGCNTCYCFDDGTFGCTEIGCFPSPTPAVIRPTPLHALICPYVAPSTTGTCSQMCSSDMDCADGQMCCSNGCGRACMLPDRVPYYSIPVECPTNTMLDLVSTCDTAQRPCTDNSACAANQLCCQSGGCGRYCTQAVTSMQPCFAVRELFTSADLGGLPGAFIPACQDDGSFSPSQFHGSTGLSWCVDVRTGYPMSPFYPRGSTPQCSSCVDAAGGRYQVGESFPSPDCNTCSCGAGGQVICTLIGCPSTCSLPPVTGPCRAAIPAFYYDLVSGSCHSFTYGGCGGNANKFRSIHDCLTMCDASDRCLQPKVVGVCDALFPSYFFNSTSGTCEPFNYGGCGGNQNKFSTRAECLAACAPDDLLDRCSTVDCDEPNCPRGSQLTRDETRCCPYCVTHTVECSRGEMQCSNGDCIPREYVCDSLRDCPNGEDELDCAEPCDFTCGDGTCLDSSHVCDNLLDCNDHSDAQNCSRDLSAVVYLQPSDIPQQCPDANDLTAVCDDTCGSGCREGQVCCSTGCGMSCTTGIPMTPVCRSIARQVRQSGLLGAFVPSCEEDGSFSERQCRERFCWCVDVQTGQPVTNGMIVEQSCSRCFREDGDSLPIGASFSSDDGCNTCKCTQEHGIICTNQPCVTRSCRLGDTTITHQTRYRDPCSVCECVSGRLSCNRTECSVRETEPVMVTMTFDGDFDAVVNDEEQVIREVKRTLLSEYKKLNLLQDQVRSVQLSKGSIVVSVILEPTNTTAGANLTILLGQLEQDYTSGTLVIRYNGMVLEPTGEFRTGEASQGLLWWHILIIAVGAVLLLMVSITTIIVVVMALKRNGKTNSYQEPIMDDYDVSFKKDQSAISFQ